MILPLSLLALSLASTPALAAKPGDIEYVGDTLVSAMMVRSSVCQQACCGVRVPDRASRGGTNLDVPWK